MINQSIKTSSKPLPCCCGKFKDKKFKEIDTHLLVKCLFCGLVRLGTVQSDPVAFLDDVNTSDGLEYWGYPNFFKKYEPVFKHYFEERYNRISQLSPGDGVWLDIGSGYGFWQMFLNEKKRHNFGIEIEKNAVRYGREMGVNVDQVSIENFSPTNSFSVITMCDVLEHVEKPQEILAKCFEMLESGGLLYIQVPNVLGLKYPYGDSLGLPHHLWQFDPATMKTLLKQQGFRLHDYWTGIQGVIRYYEAGGPSQYRKLMWKMASNMRIGNRLQILVSK